MQAFITEATRPLQSITGAARWNWRKRRIELLLRNFGRAVASGVTDVRRWPLKALHDSRSQLAARVIDGHRHLIQDYRCAGVLHCADDLGLDPQQTRLTEQ
jgi:hypothetical protein